jgi:hypothetical protein
MGTAFLLIAPLATAVVLSFEQDEPSRPWAGIAEVLLMSICFCVPVLVGFALGAPAWAFLHRRGNCRWHDAALVGFNTTFLIVFLFFAIASKLTVFAPTAAAGAGLVGALAWLTAWRTAYRAASAPLTNEHKPSHSAA